MIEGVEHAAGGFSGGAEIERGLTAPRAHLEPRPLGYSRTEFERVTEQRESLLTGHEALGRFGQDQEFALSTHEVAKEMSV